MRFQNCRRIPMVAGVAEPTWPLPETTPRFATWSLCGVRPSSCTSDDNTKCVRWHSGVDLTKAADNALVAAPEDLVIVKVNVNWSKGKDGAWSRATFARTKTGLFLVFGGVRKDSHTEWAIKVGDAILQGEPIGRIQGSYGMLHFETYIDDDESRTSNSRWYIGEEPPDGLVNPVNYLQRAAGMAETLETWPQRIQALLDLGYEAGDATWDWGDQAIDALKVAQRDLGLDDDGIWGPNTEAAIQNALATYDAQTPEPAPKPTPAPEPTPDPMPTSTPQPEPAPAPEPAPDSTPAPAPTTRVPAPRASVGTPASTVKPWLWVPIGAGVLGLGVAAYKLLVSSSPESPRKVS